MPEHTDQNHTVGRRKVNLSPKPEEPDSHIVGRRIVRISDEPEAPIATQTSSRQDIGFSDKVESRANFLLRLPQNLTENDLMVIRENLHQRVERLDDKFGFQEKELDPELAALVSEIREEFVTYFRELGIEITQKFPKIVMIPSQGESVLHNSAHSAAGRIVIEDIPVGIESDNPAYQNAQNVRLFNLSKTLIHEFYHWLAPAVLTYRRDKEDLKTEREGLQSFSARNLQIGNAIEEGSAKLIEYDFMNTLLARKFPEIFQNYRRALQQITQGSENFELKSADNQLIPGEALGIHILEGKLALRASYPDSIKLVKYLREVIPDFTQLVEKGRIEGDLLPLGRKLKEVFGSTSTKDIFLGESPLTLILLANESNAVETMAKLKMRKTS